MFVDIHIYIYTVTLLPLIPTSFGLPPSGLGIARAPHVPSTTTMSGTMSGWLAITCVSVWIWKSHRNLALSNS